MRILISGAGGFIGSHLVEASVQSGHDVRAIVNYNSRGDIGSIEDLAPSVRAAVDVRRIDIRDVDGVYTCCENVDAVFHLAALIGIPYSYVAPASYVDVNVTGTLNFLNAVRRFGLQRLIHTSTSEVYGSAQYVPIDERHPLVGQSPYSASKIAADKIAESFALSFGTPVTVIRPFNTFGPRQSLRAIIPTLASQLLDDGVSEVRAGSTTPVRDFTYVTDTARAYLCALERDVTGGQAINLGTGTGYSIAEIYEKLQVLIGTRKPLISAQERVRPEDSEVQRLISNNSLAAERLGWKPAVPFDEGLAQVVDYLRRRPAARSAAYHL